MRKRGQADKSKRNRKIAITYKLNDRRSGFLWHFSSDTPTNSDTKKRLQKWLLVRFNYPLIFTHLESVTKPATLPLTSSFSQVRMDWVPPGVAPSG
ncbi:MAG: hypothetical protein DKT66_09540 [Candidatus Melainabacteria bacterium]|nr:MAG: hypothetical protein DKT66_09540 [Candidatus Melainabacteria bacterium]